MNYEHDLERIQTSDLKWGIEWDYGWLPYDVTDERYVPFDALTSNNFVRRLILRDDFLSMGALPSEL